MATITITINIDELGLVQDEETGELYPGGDMMSDLAKRVMTQLQSKIRGINVIQEQLSEQVNAAVNSMVKPYIENILTEQIQPTDRYGNSKGEAITIRGLVMEQAEKWAKPGDSRSNYSSNNNGNMGELVKNLVDAHIKKELQPIINVAAQGIDREVYKMAVEAAVASLKKQADRAK